MAADFSIKIERLDACVRAFEEADLKTPPEFMTELRRIGERVAEAARGEAVLKGDVYHGVPTDHGDPSRTPGDLARKIDVRGAGAFRVAVVEYSRTRSKKYPGGYPYPRRIEYGPGGRAFMRPAAELMTPVAVQMVDEMVDRIFESEGF